MKVRRKCGRNKDFFVGGKLDKLYDYLYNIEYMTNLVAISDARANLPELVNKVSENLERFVITINGQPKAVLVSEEELESLEETAEILAIPGAKEAIRNGLKQVKKGEVRPFEEVLKNVA